MTEIKTRIEKTATPEDVKSSMKNWRLGFGGITPYIEFHKGLAEKTLELLKSQGVIVHNTWIASDGWGDGMKVIWAVIECADLNFYKIHWNDSNQEFFMQSKSGGSFPLRFKD